MTRIVSQNPTAAECLSAAVFTHHGDHIIMKLLRSFIRLFLFLFGLAGFGGFFMPVVRRRILNIGNAAGIVICVCVILYALFMPAAHKLLCAFWQTVIGKVFVSILAAGAVLGVILVLVMTTLMIKAACTPAAPNATVIVLGCKVYGERPSISLEERLKAALAYLNANPASACIVSGGQGADETISEAECMYLYLTSNGIAPNRIYKEDQSTTTRENLAFSYEIIKEHGLNEQIAIATNNYHEYRAGQIAEGLGLEYGAVSGETALWLLSTYYARELLAILYEWVF